MSNTLIQIKRSTTSATPSNLNIAEPAYSYTSNVLYIGTQDGLGSLQIGGQFFTQRANDAYDVGANAFDKANTANVFAYNVNANTVAAFDQANTAYGQGNTAYNQANTAYNQANTAYDRANTAATIGSSAFDEATTKLDSTGGIISGNLEITGNLTITGNVVSVDTTDIVVNDPILLLANNNTTDAVDIGVTAHYANDTSVQVHTGVYRHHVTKEWYVFDSYDSHYIDSGNIIDPNGNNFSLAVLNADIRTSNLNLGGTNTIVWITNAYDTANAGVSAASAAYDTANAGFTAASAAYDQANTGTTIATSAFGVANSGSVTASAAYDQANTANVNAANASFLTTGIVPAAQISGSYPNITGVGTITGGTWTANTVTVPYGGTGATTFTTNGVLYGNGSGSLSVTAAGTEGQVLQATSTGVPQFGNLDGGSF